MDSFIVNRKPRGTAQQFKHFNSQQSTTLDNTTRYITRQDYLRSLSATELQQLRKSIQRELFILTFTPKILSLAALYIVLILLLFVQI